MQVEWAIPAALPEVPAPAVPVVTPSTVGEKVLTESKPEQGKTQLKPGMTGPTIEQLKGTAPAATSTKPAETQASEQKK